MKSTLCLIRTLCLLVLTLMLSACGPQTTGVRVACKNFSEQLILGELVAQRLEQKHLPVVRRFGFGSTPLIHQALVSGEIDLYVEYLGTAEQAILQVPKEADEAKALARLRTAYEQRFQATWLDPLGFDNTYIFVTKKGSAADQGTLSRLASVSSSLVAGLNSEFIDRPDGYPAVRQTYGLRFKEARSFDVGLLYPALELNSVQVIVAFSTDGRLADPVLTTLTDDQGCFPRYAAVPVVRLEAMQKWPKLRSVLAELGGRLDAPTMRRLNRSLEIEKRPAAAVAREYWQQASY